MGKIIVALLLFCLASFFVYCSDGLFGDCTSLADTYCSGVEDCTDLNGEKYIKVGDDRYACAASLEWEDTYNCSAGYAAAEKYCNSNPGPPPAPKDNQCYRTDNTGKKICYGSMMTQSQCSSCGWSWGAVTCDSSAGSLIYSPPNCH